MISELTARTSSSQIPNRSTTPGLKFCINTSAVAASDNSAFLPSADLRSSVTPRLFLLLFRKVAVNCDSPNPAPLA